MVITLLLVVVALAVSLFAFPPAAIILGPVLLIGVAVLGLSDFKRRRKQIQEVQHHRAEADSDGVDFSDQDKRTLTS